MDTAFLAPVLIALALLGVVLITIYKASKFEYRCTNCSTQFAKNAVTAALAPQSRGKKYLVCPNCKQKQFCHLIYKGK